MSKIPYVIGRVCHNLLAFTLHIRGEARNVSSFPTGRIGIDEVKH
jgi:hypothetical protein